MKHVNVSNHVGHSAGLTTDAAGDRPAAPRLTVVGSVLLLAIALLRLLIFVPGLHL